MVRHHFRSFTIHKVPHGRVWLRVTQPNVPYVGLAVLIVLENHAVKVRIQSALNDSDRVYLANTTI